MQRVKFQIDESIFQAGHTAAVELIAESIPRLFSGGPLLMPIHKDVALVCVQVEGEAAFGYIAGAAHVFESSKRIAPGKDRAGIAVIAEAIVNAPLAQLRGTLVSVGCGVVNGSVGLTVAVIEDDKRALVACAIGVGVDVFVNRA